ncbi:MAG: hypothetical protein RLZZ153_1987 [Pseudomonadota bacterium]|jgi:formylglycine-generating enzyme required for sulfatase activity
MNTFPGIRQAGMLAARRKQLPAQGHRPCTLGLIVYSELMKLISVAFLLSIALGAAAQVPDMVKIPAGPFIMGSNEGHEDERPAHTVTLAAFEIDRLQVSNAEFAQFLARYGTSDSSGRRYFDWDDRDARIHRIDGVWRADPGFEDHPVVEASWLGALAYCQSLGKRLPTEAEWEKAARGTDARRYPWGNEAPTSLQARFASGWNETVSVAAHTRYPSPYGVVGMAGNAWHWVSSAYRPYPYRDDDGREDLTPGPVRATRGGGHDSGATELRTAERGRTLSRAPAAGHHNIGFRCAR